MGWASGHIAKLQQGETVQFRRRDNSMIRKIRSGQPCTITPLQDDKELKKGDMVLCKVKGAQYLHFIEASKVSTIRLGTIAEESMAGSDVQRSSANASERTTDHAGLRVDLRSVVR